MSSDVASAIRQQCATAVGDTSGLDALRNQGVLITGGTGFMGSWLAETVAWLNDEHAFGITLHLLARNAFLFAKQAPRLAGRGDIRLIEADVRDIGALPPEVTYVVHAAGTPDSRVHATDPLRTMSTIAGGSSAVLRAAAAVDDLRKVLMISSGLVYGEQPLDMPGMPETYAGGLKPDSISAVYAEAKRYAETEAAAWRSQSKVPIVTARPFAFIGPYQGLDKPWAVNNFLRDAVLGVPIRILGDADTVRSYMYPSDMAHWLLRILADGTPGTAYNVGSPEGITLGALAERIAGSVEEPPAVLCRPLGEPRINRFVPDVSRAESTLGVRLTVDLDTAIQRTLEWHRSGGGAG